MTLPRLPRSLKFGYAIGLILVAGFSSVIWLSTVIMIDAQEVVAAEVNVAGRQRMLSQRIAWLSAGYGVDESTYSGALAGRTVASEIRACADLMLRAHQALLSRDATMIRASAAEGVNCREGAPEAVTRGEMSAETNILFFAGEPSLDTMVRSFTEAARATADGRSEDRARLIREMALVGLPEKLDALTQGFQRLGETRIEKLLEVKTAMWIATLLLLVLEVVFIFRPLERGIRKSVAGFKRTITLLRERERANALLRDENAAKTRFLAHMSHEFRTPLNAIIGFSEMLCAADQLGMPEKKRAEYSGDIRQAGGHLLGLVNDILDMARMDADVARPTVEEADVERIVRSSVAMVGPIADQNGVSVDVSIDMGRASLWADSRMVRQILLNLMTNAVKYNRRGGWVRVLVSGQADGSVRMEVVDNGIGIAPEHLPHMLEPFSQSNRDPAIASDGVGLGLALCNRMVALHGGTLTIDSDLGRGTTVIVKFPGPASTVVPLRAAS